MSVESSADSPPPPTSGHAASMAVLDHLVFFVPDLDIGVDDAERRYGVRPVPGGQHPGRGTHNALLSLGDCYLELIAPDPGQPAPSRPRPFGIDERDDAGFVAFAVRPSPTETIGDLVDAMRSVDVDPGEPTAMARSTPAGDELRWQLTFPIEHFGGAVPFLIDWGTTPKPHTTAPAGPTLTSLRVTTEHATDVARVAVALALEHQVAVDVGPFSLVPEFGSDD